MNSILNLSILGEAKMGFIRPETIKKAVRDLISITKEAESADRKLAKDPESMSTKELKELIGRVRRRMERAATNLDFESAAQLRDRMLELRKFLDT